MKMQQPTTPLDILLVQKHSKTLTQVRSIAFISTVAIDELADHLEEGCRTLNWKMKSQRQFPDQVECRLIVGETYLSRQEEAQLHRVIHLEKTSHVRLRITVHTFALIPME